MPALGLDHLIAVGLLEQRGHAQAGSGPDDAGHALLGKRLLGTAEMLEMLVAKRGHRISHRPEIVDDRVAVDAEPLLDQRGADHPGIVGELQKLPADGTGEGDGELVGMLARAPAKFLPCELEAPMLRGLERDRLAERDHSPAVDPGKREARVGSSDVGDGDLTAHACSASIAASIADAPASASLA